MQQVITKNFPILPDYKQDGLNHLLSRNPALQYLINALCLEIE